MTSPAFVARRTRPAIIHTSSKSSRVRFANRDPGGYSATDGRCDVIGASQSVEAPEQTTRWMFQTFILDLLTSLYANETNREWSGRLPAARVRDRSSGPRHGDARACSGATAICRGDRGIVTGVTPAAPDEDDVVAVSRYLCIHFPHKLSKLLLDLAHTPAIVAELTEVIGPNVKMMQSMLFITAPVPRSPDGMGRLRDRFVGTSRRPGVANRPTGPAYG